MKCDVFISYRRDGGDMTAMYIYQALKERGYDVFYDLEVLRAGKFNDALLENIRACKDFVLILSPHALDRCSDENDWVRKEIAEALRQKKNIVPIMLNGFSFPEKLPDDIDDVRYQNGLTATTEYFMESVNRLCTRYLNSKPKKKGKGLMIAIIAAVLSLAVAAGTILYFTMGPGGAPKALPTATPTAVPTATPTAEPTAAPTATPTATPTAEPTATPAPTMLSGTDLPLLREENLLEQYDISVRYYDNPVFGNEAFRRGQIRSVTFLPTLRDKGENAWDISAAQDGSAMAWTIPNGALYDLYIAGEGGVRLMGNTIFTGYTNAEFIDFNGCVDFSNNTSMRGMFDGCTSIKHIDLSTLDTSNVTDMCDMFGGCYNLVSVNLTGVNTSRVTEMTWMFLSCSSLESLDLSGFNTRRVTTMENMFYGCENLRTLDLSAFNTSRVTTMESMFDSCRRLRKLTLPDGFVGPSVENMTHMFTLCGELDQLDVSTWDVSSVKYMMGLFENCHYLLELDVADWNMENVMDTSYMFNECHSLDTLDLSRWNTPNNTDMRLMFLGCHSLKELDLSSMNTQNVTTMEGLFESCGDLHTLILPERLVGPSVTSTRAMFNCCSALQTLDVTTWDMSSVEDTNHMFAECHALAALDFSSWDLSRVTESEGMLAGWPNAPESIPTLSN